MTNPLDLFSSDYHVATCRFREAAARVGAQIEQYPIHEPRESPGLTIDVATVGSDRPRQTVVVSSGVHGVEGFFGSAIQLGWLSRLSAGASLPNGVSVVLIHAVNPFGFARLRLANEDNVDLNRNFLNATQSYDGAPAGYAFDPETVEPATDDVATAYDASGTLGGWAAGNLASESVRYRFVTAEFGTYSIVRVLGALRAENRAHHFGQSGTRTFERAKTELLECFCPRSDYWRSAVLVQDHAVTGAQTNSYAVHQLLFLDEKIPPYSLVTDPPTP